MAVQPTSIILIESPANVALLPSSLEGIGTAVEASQGSFGIPSNSNRFITETDPRMPVFDSVLNVFFIGLA